MSCWNRRITALLAVLLICTLSACGQSQIPLDYGDETAFEADLNAGKNLVGKTVSFVAAELHPQSLYGYDIWAGEHLNFISSKNPDIEVGQTVTVKVTAVESVIGSWFIEYEKVDAAADENTIYAADVEDSDNADETEAPQPLEIADYGWYADPPHSGADTMCLHYCGMMHNPNETLVASYPKITVTISNPDGTVIATDSQMAFLHVMPEDTATIIGSMSVPLGRITNETMVSIHPSWDSFTSVNLKQVPRTTDFEIGNVTEQPGSQSFVTGTITNLTESTVDSVSLSMIMRKEDKIVFMEESYVGDLRPGTPAAFQFDRYSAWPEHDAVEFSAQAW
ncbi:MAG: hypothetical protein ACLUE5_00025 [Dysosmobacter sp.]|uniref:hypothetical protein n=1 Tax=Dysosmobacter sp. TaxID=2591382 RepID=UPI003A226E22